MKKETITIGSFFSFILLALCLMAISGVQAGTSSKPERLLEEANQCRKTLYRSNKKMKYRHNWLNCINLYKKIYTRYPGSEQAPWAMYHTGRMYTKLYQYSGMDKDLDTSIELYKRLAEDFKEHRLADDAQYRVGEIYYIHKKDPMQAYVEFLKVEIKFPEGDMRPRARVMLDKLTVVLNKKEREKVDKRDAKPAPTLTLVKDIRHWSTPTYTRVVIDLERPVKYSSDLLKADPKHKKPRRLYVDLKRTYVSKDIDSTIPIRDGLLQRARAGQYLEDTVRVVLDIQSIGGYKIFPLHDPFRIVVDVRADKKSVKKTVRAQKVKKRPVRKGIRRAEKPDEKISLARQLGLSVRRIVIDPGHGGRDPGTSYKSRVEEKKIVLRMAKKLARKIEKKLKCEVMLTRSKDQFLSLENRTAFANVKKADLFISLHVNSYKTKKIYGVETYFLNMATDERAVMLAAAENATSQKNISDLQTILNELMLNTKINESSRLAYEVQKGVISTLKRKYKGVRSQGVKQAPFYVLIGAEMPAILIEMGYITNPRERNRLLNDNYLDRMADGIVAGTDSYIKSIEVTYKGGG